MMKKSRVHDRQGKKKAGKNAYVRELSAEELSHESHNWPGWSASSAEPRSHASNTEWVKATPSDDKETFISFRVVSWNILAENYAYHHFYKHLGKETGRVLDWKNRCKQILEHLGAIDADIICLQECQEFAMMQSVLAGWGYDGEYKQRTGHKEDGLAIFWRREKFEIIGKSSWLEFGAKMGREGEDRVALRVTLAYQRKTITIATLHLDYKRPRSQIQMAELLAQWLREERRGNLIVCGDWNCQLGHEAVQRFLAGMGGAEKYKPAVPQMSPGGARVSTAYMKEHHKHIDHMFFAAQFLRQSGLKVPSMSQSPLPHREYPSDHELVGGQFEILDRE